MNRDAQGAQGDCRGLCRFAEARQFRAFQKARRLGSHRQRSERLTAEGLGYSSHFGYPCELAFGTVVVRDR